MEEKKPKRKSVAEVDPAIGVPANDFREVIDALGDENLSLMIKEGCRLERKYGASHERSIDALVQIAHACEDIEHFNVARQLHESILKTIVASDGTGNEVHASTLSNLGEICRKLEVYDKAEAYLTEALAIHEKISGEHHPHTAFTLNSLVGLYTDQEKFDQAAPLSKRSLDIFSGELLAQIMIKDLDTGKEVALSTAESFLPKGVNPIELHSIEEILATCMVKNLDTGSASTLEKVESVAPRVEDPMALHNYEDVLATMVIKNLDTGQATTLDTASGTFVPTSFAPTTKRTTTTTKVEDKKSWTGNKLKMLLRSRSTTTGLSRTSSDGSRSSRSSRSSRTSTDRPLSQTEARSPTPLQQNTRASHRSSGTPLVDPKKVAQYKAPQSQHVPEVFEGD